MGYKAVILDLDGTTLNDKHLVSDYTKEIITKVVDKGIKVVIATGRGYHEGIYALDYLDLDTGFITNNGSKIYKGKNHELIKEFILDKEITNAIIDYPKYDDVMLNLYANDDWYVEKEITEERLIHYQKEADFYAKIVDMEIFRDKEITKIVYIGDRKKLEDINDYFLDNFPDQIATMFSAETSLEIINIETSKAHAMELILEDFGIDVSEAIAIGDGFNDYEMLKAAGKGYIMGNAHYSLKDALPEMEIIEDNNSDGVAKILKKIFLD